MQYILLLALLILGSCVPLTQSSSISESNPKTLRLIDFAYEPQIRTILIHGADGNTSVTKFGEWNLMLEFDDLRNQVDNYNAKIIHCNHNWTKSDLMDLDFLRDFNDFIINNYQYSIDTHIPYVHYAFNLPAVKLPGNYVIAVYRAGNENDILLTKRFMVYDNKITFTQNGNLVGAGKIAAINQQINFTVDYKNEEIINPLETVNVSIRQNHRWDNMATQLKPSFMRDFDKQLEYRFFDDKKMFNGGNEFRFFDLRSLSYPGRNVDYVDKKVKPFEAIIQKDKSRSNEVYGQYRDLDGDFYVENLDYNDANFTNYLYVNFKLSSPKINGTVYVNGAFNYWNLLNENQMHYDTARNEYTARVLLKQGWYDYQYFVKSTTLPPYYFEGSYFETQNTYEVFVYYKPFKPRADLLIGYMRLESNPR